jgi:hypothetical protein
MTMKLFDAPNRCRVKLTSKLVRWIDHHKEHVVAENVQFEADTTGKYFYYKGARRRLLINHSVTFWPEYGIWARDTHVEIVASPSATKAYQAPESNDSE